MSSVATRLERIEAAIAEAKASGLALEGDSFIVMRRFSYGWSEGFKPYRIGDVGPMLQHIAEHGRKIYPCDQLPFLIHHSSGSMCHRNRAPRQAVPIKKMRYGH